jgi:hypothetical protein
MKAFVAGGALVAAIFFWDSMQNHNRLTTHAEAMLRDIRHHVFR